MAKATVTNTVYFIFNKFELLISSYVARQMFRIISGDRVRIKFRASSKSHQIIGFQQDSYSQTVYRVINNY